MSEPLDKFGRFVVENLRDTALRSYLWLRAGRAAAPSVQTLMREFSSFSPEQKAVVDAIVLRIVDVALHDLLFAFQDAYDRELGIHLTVDGDDVVAESGMLHGEPLGDAGWVARFSKHRNFPAG